VIWVVMIAGGMLTPNEAAPCWIFVASYAALAARLIYAWILTIPAAALVSAGVVLAARGIGAF
jgi:phosphate/sulfate permease